MTHIFITGILIYFITMASIGYLASRKITSFDEYLIAGRRIPFFLALPTIVATWFGAGSSMGVSGTVYSKGFYGVLADPFGCSLALILTGLVFAIPFRKLRLLTISDLLRNSYGSRFETVSTLMMIPFYIGTLASQMLAMGYVFHIISGISPEIGIILGSAIVVGYTIAGGMWAVTLTDFVQFTLLVLGLLVILPAGFEYVDDQALVFQQMKEEFLNLLPKRESSFDLFSYSGRVLMTTFGAIMGQDLLQRSMATKSESIARWSAIAGGCVYFLLGLIPLFLGLAGRQIFPSLEQPEMLIPLLAQSYLSPLAFTIFACGLFSAIMSTADSYLLAGSSLLTQNILLKSSKIKTESHKIRLIRLTNLVLAILAIFLAFTGSSIFDMMVHSGATLFVSIFIPATTALFLKKKSLLGAWGALLGGLIGWLSATAFGHYYHLGAYDDILFASAMVGFIFSGLCYLIGRFIEPIYFRTTPTKAR